MITHDGSTEKEDGSKQASRRNANILYLRCEHKRKKDNQIYPSQVQYRNSQSPPKSVVSKQCSADPHQRVEASGDHMTEIAREEEKKGGGGESNPNPIHAFRHTAYPECEDY